MTSYRQARDAIEAAREQSDKPEELCGRVDSPELLAALFDWGHRQVYRTESEVAGRDWRRQVNKGRRLAADHFGGRLDLAAHYTLWVLRRAAGKPNGQRVGWGLVCSGTMVADFRTALVKSGQLEGFRELVAEDAEEPEAPTVQAFERGDHVELAQALLEVLQQKAPVVHADGDFWNYVEARGLWSTVEPGKLSRIVQGFAGSMVGEGKSARPLKVRSGDVGGTLRLAADVAAKPDHFRDAPRGIAFADKFVKIGEDGSLDPSEHSPDNRARYGYGFAFDPDAACPRWLEMLGGYFRDDADAAAKVALVQEFSGVSLLGLAPRLQRALVFVGDGGTGKSTVMDVVARCFPASSVDAIPPQTWSSEYRLAKLAGKLLNACNELPEADIIHSEPVKAAITGDLTTARHIRQAPFTFRPVAGHLFATNTLPGTNDQTGGFWRRFLVVEFNRPIPEAEMRAGIASEVLADEQPGIVSWMLQGAARALRAGRYTTPASCAAAIAKWRQAADQVAAFVDEVCERAPSDDAPAGTGPTTLYQAYATWARANGHRAVSSTRFGSRLKLLGHEQHRSKSGRWYALRLLPQPLPARRRVTAVTAGDS